MNHLRLNLDVFTIYSHTHSHLHICIEILSLRHTYCHLHIDTHTHTLSSKQAKLLFQKVRFMCSHICSIFGQIFSNSIPLCFSQDIHSIQKFAFYAKYVYYILQKQKTHSIQHITIFVECILSACLEIPRLKLKQHTTLTIVIEYGVSHNAVYNRALCVGYYCIFHNVVHSVWPSISSVTKKLEGFLTFFLHSVFDQTATLTHFHTKLCETCIMFHVFCFKNSRQYSVYNVQYTVSSKGG